MDDVRLVTFPSSRNEALAMLYLQNQDLSKKTPAQVHEMYWYALAEIRKDYKEKRENGFFTEL